MPKAAVFQEKRGNLTAEFFRANGVGISDTPRRSTDLVPHQVTPQFEQVRLGVEAMLRLSSGRSRDWADWCLAMQALGVGRQQAMIESGTNAAKGSKYCVIFSKWLRGHPEFQAIHETDRKRMFDCLDNLPAIENWREGLSPAQRHKWNYPPTVLREWKKSLGLAKACSGSRASQSADDAPPNKLELWKAWSRKEQQECLDHEGRAGLVEILSPELLADLSRHLQGLHASKGCAPADPPQASVAMKMAKQFLATMRQMMASSCDPRIVQFKRALADEGYALNDIGITLTKPRPKRNK
jgi:hypothetical protein